MEPWFVEKYDPSEVYKWKLIQMEVSKYAAEIFEPDMEVDLTEGSTKTMPFDPDSNTAFLKFISV